MVAKAKTDKAAAETAEVENVADVEVIDCPDALYGQEADECIERQRAAYGFVSEAGRVKYRDELVAKGYSWASADQESKLHQISTNHSLRQKKGD